MYSAIRIQGFRGLADIALRGIGRVNLLVGVNNCGKTSILEAIRIFAAKAPGVLAAIAADRGEWHQGEDGQDATCVDLSHLFTDRGLHRPVQVEVADYGLDRSYNMVLSAKERRLRACWSGFDGLNFDIPLIMPTPARATNSAEQDVQFIGSGGLRAPQVVKLFEDVVLTDAEELVTQCLRIVEPNLERIATVAADRHAADSPRGMYVKLKGAAARVPIGSAGDGMWRMLGLALALVNAKNSVLLVDEIDAGLHYTVMESMWRMIREQAVRLKVQVFATTHSRDCYESLAPAVRRRASRSEAVSILRVEKNQRQAVNINDEAIIAAAERGIELR